MKIRTIIEPESAIVERAIQIYEELPDAESYPPNLTNVQEPYPKSYGDGAYIALAEALGPDIYTRHDEYMDRLRGVLKGMQKKLGRERRLT